MEYFEKLSEASVVSLQLQGGPMNRQEIEEFQSRPFSEEAVRLRRYDDRAKLPEANTPGLEEFKPILLHLLLQ